MSLPYVKAAMKTRASIVFSGAMFIICTLSSMVSSDSVCYQSTNGKDVQFRCSKCPDHGICSLSSFACEEGYQKFSHGCFDTNQTKDDLEQMQKNISKIGKSVKLEDITSNWSKEDIHAALVFNGRYYLDEESGEYRIYRVSNGLLLHVLSSLFLLVCTYGINRRLEAQ